MHNEISLLTLHFYDNYGSVLQAYALRETLRRLGYDAQIVPFRPNLPEHRYFDSPELVAHYEEKRRVFEDFRRIELGTTRPDRGREVLSELKSDTYIVGSDIVWSREHSALDPAYFLDFAGGRRISYAASMVLRECDHALLSEHLPKFDAISVRERSNVELISRLSGKSVASVLDPALLLSPDDYIRISDDSLVPDEPYLLSYCLTHDPALVDYTNVLARKFGLKIVHYWADYPKRLFPNNTDCFAFCGPKEWLGLVKNAKMVLTNSYHGTIFSFLFGTSFYTHTAKRGMLSRILDLVSLLGLEKHCAASFADFRNVTMNADFSNARENTLSLREESIEFLRNALEGSNV